MGFFKDFIGSSLGGLISGISSAYSAKKNYEAQKEANATNVMLTRETNALNEQLTREAWNRDDTAYQRKVADLKAAGLNPILAASGSGSPNSTPATMISPSVDPNVKVDPLTILNNIITTMSNIQALKQQKLNYLKTMEETNNLSQDTASKSLDNQYKGLVNFDLSNKISFEKARRLLELEAMGISNKNAKDSNVRQLAVALSQISRNDAYSSYLKDIIDINKEANAISRGRLNLGREQFEVENRNSLLKILFGIGGKTLKYVPFLF